MPDENLNTLDLDALEVLASTEEAKADASKLSAEETRRAELVDRVKKARERAAVNARTRRETDLTRREEAARQKAAGEYLVKGLDLGSCFLADAVPPAERMPGNGVIIFREPSQDALNDLNAELERKAIHINVLLRRLACSAVLDPDVSTDTEAGRIAGLKISAFFERYSGAGTAAGDLVLKLGGARSEAIKRGSA